MKKFITLIIIIFFSSNAMADKLLKSGFVSGEWNLDTNFKDITSRVKNYLERGIVIKKGETFLDLFYNRKTLYEKYRNLSINNSILDITATTNIIHNLF